MENADFIPPLISAFIFSLYVSYELLSSGIVITGGNEVSLNKEKKIKKLPSILGQIKGEWLLRCVQTFISEICHVPEVMSAW